MARSSAVRAKEARPVRAKLASAKPAGKKRPVRIQKTSTRRMSAKPVARGALVARARGAAISIERRRTRTSTATSIAPGRSGNSLRVAYTATAKLAQGPITGTTLRVAAIPPGQQTIDADQLASTLNFQTVAAWSQSGLSALFMTFDSQPGQEYPDPQPGSWTMFQLQVKQGPVVTQIVNEPLAP